MSYSKNDLKNELKATALKKGEFTLASGKKSNLYVDVKQTALTPRGSQLIGEGISEIILKEFSHLKGVGGMTLGADPLTTATVLSLFQKGREIPGFIVRKESKGYGANLPIEGLGQIPVGSPVVVLEDTATTGGSALKAIEALRKSQYRVIGVITVIDREEGARENLNQAGIDRFHSLFTLGELLK